MTVESVDRPRTSGAPRWLAPALIASLALNLVVLGAAAGFAWRHWPALQEGGGRYMPPSLLNYTTTLPPDRFKALMAMTEEQRQAVLPLRRNLREARQMAVEVLTTEPFDKARFQLAEERVLAADYKAREAVYQLYTAIAANMSPEERQAYARWREEKRTLRSKIRHPLDDPGRPANTSQR